MSYRKAEGIREDHRRRFWMRETGMGQQAAQRHDSYMMVMMMMMMMNVVLSFMKFRSW